MQIAPMFFSGARFWKGFAFFLFASAHPGSGFADLAAYDASITADETTGGLVPSAKLLTAASFTGGNSQAFDFGATSGDVTMEFILEGDPAASGAVGYLAVGSDSSSSLRYEQWSDTGQLGFTESGVLDYVFSPSVLSPTAPVHIAYVWDGDGRMNLYENGVDVGQRTGVDGSFNMPSGSGFLGGVGGGSQGMVGTIHRVTVYDTVLAPEAIRRHSDAYNGVTYPPVIGAFTASPDAYLAPGASTLTWTVSGAQTLSVNGVDVTGQSSLVVAPGSTTDYTLSATNADGTVQEVVTVTVDPAARILGFTADRPVIVAGQSVTLSWQTQFASTWAIGPFPGDVAAQTSGGAGSIAVVPATTTTFTMTAGGPFGGAAAGVTVEVAVPAAHPVISEFMADNDSVLADGAGDFEDWIEIFNPTATPIDLAGYHLTDDPTNLTKWTFPAHVLPSGGRVVVFASGKVTGTPPGELHANFRLAKGGEYLALVAPGGGPVLHEFSPAFPPQSSDVSYGIFHGDPSRVQFMGVPTPGAANDPTPPAPKPVTFSVASQTFTGTLGIVLSSATAGASIYYTTDGSAPSPANGTLYSSPVTVGATTHLRAVAEFAGQSSPVSGEMYIRLAADLASYQSDLPLLVIDNFGGGTIPAKGSSGTGAGVQQVERQSAVWAAFDRDPSTGMVSLGAAPQMISRVGIRGRGAFSSTWSQKPYSVEAWDEAEAEREVAVLDMPKHADWVLYYPDPGPNRDSALVYNSFMYQLSNNMGRYAARLRWVEAFINEDGGDLSLSDRRGLYGIVEKVSRGDGRLDFKRLSDDGTSGSFLLTINRMDSIPPGGFPAANGATTPQFFHTRGPNRVAETPPNTPSRGDDIPRQSNGFLNFDNPNGYKINAAQRAAIENWFVTFEDVLYNNALWRDPVLGYPKYLDAQDFVDYFILNNLSRNGDGLLVSIFPWVGDDGRLRMGPVWDYNYSAASFQGSGPPQGTLFHRADRLWYGRLMADPDFVQLYIDRWFYHRDRALANAAVLAVIDGQAAEIGTVRAVRQGHPDAAAWEAELSALKSWLTARADWIDAQFAPRPVFTVPGGDVPAGFRVTFNSSAGTIYYTLDGTDPRAPGGGVASGAQTYDGGTTLTSLVGTGAPVRALVPTAANPAAGLGWAAVGFDDSSWQAGTTGVGYDRNSTYGGEISLDLRAAMDGVNTGVYLRVGFNVADASAYDSLVLRMKYDDGFIAYLNGVRVASGNPPSVAAWNSSSNGDHPDAEALRFVDFPIDQHLGALVDGANVLAIHGLNGDLVSSDFLIVPELRAGQSAAGAGVELGGSTLVTARALVGSDWSAPADSYFFIGTVPAGAGNLVVSEIHYRPADASPAELAAGFTDRDDFEFVELLNTGVQTLNLSGVRFLRVGGQGIEFDFSTSPLRTLAPGARVLLVNNVAAFQARYGTGLAGQVAGEYSGNLSNDGELLTLVDAGGSTIHSFAYNDKAPWPEEADGNGFSLVLIDPARTPTPDHSDPFNWRGSVGVGGTPGGADGNTYSNWKVVNGVPTPEIHPDPDRDGRDTLVEYYQGTLPTTHDFAPPSGGMRVEALQVGGVTDRYLVFRIARSLTADDVDIVVQTSADLVNWGGGSGAVVFVGRERAGGPGETLVFRSAAPLASNQRIFVRYNLTTR